MRRRKRSEVWRRVEEGMMEEEYEGRYAERCEEYEGMKRSMRV